MKNFLISFLFNLIFHLEFVVLAVIALFFNICFGLTAVFFYVFLGLWILIALIITLGLGVLSKGTSPPPYQKNVNPYSTSTKYYLRNIKNNTENSENEL